MPGKPIKPAAGRPNSLADRIDRFDPPVVPTRYDGYVRRPELVARLREARGFQCILVTAPAGYAKSSLLAEWAKQDERPFAWVTLSKRDDEPTRLLNRVVEAVDGVSLLGQPFVLVLDDIHLLRSRDALDALAGAIESLGPEGQIAVASHNEPDLPLGRMRARQQVFELTRRDLAMNRSESAALLEALGLELQVEEAEELFLRTEGWPAALYLAALSLREVSADKVDVTQFGGDDRFVADYFNDEFLSGVSAARTRFLIRSSVLDELTGQNCDEILDRSGSARVLHELARGNIPLEPLDHADGSYRYHPLFKQMLRAVLRRREPRIEDDLHRRASEWFADRERFEEAIDEAIASGDQERASGLIWARVAGSLATGDRAAVRGWLDHFSNQKVTESPGLALTAAYLYLALGDGEIALHWSSIARAHLGKVASDDPDLLTLSSALPQGGIAQMDRDATRASELHPPGSPWGALSCLYAGVARHLCGDPEEARLLLQEGARRGAATAPLVQALCLTQLAVLHLDGDDLTSAQRVMAQAREQLERFHLDVYPLTSVALATSSLIRAREGRIEEAVADHKHAMGLLEQLVGFPEYALVEIRVLLAKASLLLDDLAAARELLAEASVLAHRVTDAPVLQRWLSEALSSLSKISEGGPRTELTPSELRTLQYLPSHHSIREIAELSFLSRNTVKTQVQAIYRKLDVSSRAEAVEHASSAGLFGDESKRGDGSQDQTNNSLGPASVRQG
jgi:LuxR family transcriptional regulator, maltose regulon positive regulatory protein